MEGRTDAGRRSGAAYALSAGRARPADFSDRLTERDRLCIRIWRSKPADYAKSGESAGMLCVSLLIIVLTYRVLKQVGHLPRNARLLWIVAQIEARNSSSVGLTTSWC